MDSGLWARLHGAVIHFPVALSISHRALRHGCVVLLVASRGSSRLLAGGGYALYVAALVSVPAVISGLVLTRGIIWGHDALRWHHLFVWPAWGLLIALAVCAGTPAVDAPTRREHAIFLAGVWLMAALMGGTGHWGGLLGVGPIVPVAYP